MGYTGTGLLRDRWLLIDRGFLGIGLVLGGVHGTGFFLDFGGWVFWGCFGDTGFRRVGILGIGDLGCF